MREKKKYAVKCWNKKELSPLKVNFSCQHFYKCWQKIIKKHPVIQISNQFFDLERRLFHCFIRWWKKFYYKIIVIKEKTASLTFNYTELALQIVSIKDWNTFKRDTQFNETELQKYKPILPNTVVFLYINKNSLRSVFARDCLRTVWVPPETRPTNSSISYFLIQIKQTLCFCDLYFFNTFQKIWPCDKYYNEEI